jgi:UDP-3-O-[3-hydroxymyristoyl] glucosamine N-acyltransferase
MENKKPVILIGAGGLSVDLIDTVLYCKNAQIDGVIDNSKVPGDFYSGIKIIGNENIISKYIGTHEFLLTFSSPKWFLHRKDSIDRLKKKHPKILFTNIIDDRAFISPTASLGTGNFIGPGAYISPEVLIGDHNILLFNSIVSRYCKIGDYNFFSANVNVTGRKVIGSENYLGVKSTVNGNISDNVLLSTNAIVKNDINGPAIFDSSTKNETITFSTKKQMRRTLELLSRFSH